MFFEYDVGMTKPRRDVHPYAPEVQPKSDTYT